MGMKTSLILLGALAVSGCVSSENTPASTPPAGETTTVATTTAAAPKPSPSAGWQLLTSGTAGMAAQGQGAANGGRMAPRIEVAATADQFEPLWREHIRQSPSGVTLGGRVAAFLLMPPQSSGGYSIQVHGVTVTGTTASIDGELIEPAPGSMNTQAITAPYAVIALPAHVRTIEWKSRGRLVRMAEVPVAGSAYP